MAAAVERPVAEVEARHHVEQAADDSGPVETIGAAVGAIAERIGALLAYLVEVLQPEGEERDAPEYVPYGGEASPASPAMRAAAGGGVAASSHGYFVPIRT